MHFFDLSLLDLGKVALLFWAILALIGSTSDSHRIIGVRPPRFWFPALQVRANKAAADFEQVLAVAEGEGNKHHSSQQLLLAVQHAHHRCLPDWASVPWFRPHRFVEELEHRCKAVVARLEAAIAYEKSPAFLLEASLHLNQALEGHPEKVAAHLQEIENNFQRRLLQLQHEKESAIIRTREHYVAVGKEIATQLSAIETNLQQLVAGTTLTTTTATCSLDGVLRNADTTSRI